MSSAPTQIAVAPTSVSTSSGQIQKDYLEEPLARQNSLGNRGRGGLKGKALTRSHAMREAASPPRTPTPRSDQLSGLSPITSGNHSPSSPEAINDTNTSKMHVQSASSTQTIMETPAVIVTTQQQQQQQQQQGQQQQSQQIQQTQSHSNVVIYSSNDNNTNSGSVICNDVDFPKLTPPKSSKGARNRDNGNNNSNNNHNNNNNGGNGGVGIHIGNVNDNKIINNNNDHKIQQQQQQQQQQPTQQSQQHQQSSNSSTITGDSANYFNGKKVVNDSSNSKSPNNNHNNSNNSNGQNNNNSNSSSSNNNSNINSNNQINSPSTNTSNRNSNINNDNYTNINNNNTNSSSINVSVSQLNPQASPYINSPISPPVATSPYDKDNRCPRNESQNSNNSGNYSQEDGQNCIESPNEKSDRLSKKHRNGANSKGTKPRLKNMSGSSSSMEGGNNTSGFISRADSSTEQFTDQSGIDLVQFFKETLNKSLKDRSLLIEIEKDLIELAHDKSQKELRFQPMSSYNRMLIHRVAAFFGMEHNLDKATQQCVIVATTKATRVPDIRFKHLIRDEPRKSILKRDTHSFDDSRQGGYLGVDRGVLDRKAKSFEEREEEYEKARRRIFRGRENEMSEEQYWHWANNESGNSNGGGHQSCGGGNGGGGGGNNNNDSSRMRQSNKLLKPMERQESRQNVSKSHNISGYGGPPSNGSTQQQQQNMAPLSRGDSLNSNKSSGQRVFSKQDSAGSSNAQSWRLSPSSSGYKTQTQSLRSESITPSPTGYGSSDDHASSELINVQTTDHPASCGVVWAVTDMASVPRGSVLINPQTLQPFVNQDGSVYHYDPSNLPPNQSVAPGMYNNNSNNTHRKNKTDRQQKKSSEQNCNSSNNNNNINNCSSPGVAHVINVTTSTDSGQTTYNTVSTDTGSGTGSATIDTTSEIAGQTIVVNMNSNVQNLQNSVNSIDETPDDDDDEEDEDDIDDSSTKENQTMINREMDDIEEEIVSNNYEECEKSTLKVDDERRSLQEKPKFINQATSPNIPSPEPEYNIPATAVIIPSNEVGKPNNKSSTSDNQTSISTAISTRSTPSTTLTETKKDETKSISSNIPIMSYATGYQTIDGTVFQNAGAGPYTTTYQQGPDGSVYAVPQQMVYTAYPQPIDSGEIQGYFVYDQAAAAREGATLVPTPLYQPSSGATVVPVAAYPSAPFGSAPIYQQQVVYTPEQFNNSVAATAATAAGQVQQYPVTYPVGYSYPYNGYWGQTMTYYVPQPPLTNAVSSSIIPPPPLPIVAAGTASTTQSINIGSSINQANNSSSNHSGTTGGKRNTPPHQTQQHNHHNHHNHSNQQQQQHHHQHHHHQQHQSHHQSHHQSQSQQQQQHTLSGQNSQSATPSNATYQYATAASAGVPVALTTDPNGPTMYAIPQSAVFPNAMLPYGHPPQAQLVPTTQATQATPASVITHLPPQSQTVISPMIAQSAGGGPPGSLLPPQHIIDQTGAISIQQQSHTNAVSHSNGNNIGTGNHGNRSCTPQSTPSTPVSNTLPTMNHHPHSTHRNNPPLFATPPMLPNGFNSQIANNSYQPQHYTESHSHHHSSQQQQQQQFNQQQSHSGTTSSVSSTSYEKKNSYSNVKKNSGNNNNHNNSNNSNNNSGTGGYNNNNSGNRQNSYSNNVNNSNQRKVHENTNNSVNSYNNSNNSNNSTNISNSNNNRQIYNTGQSNNNKRINNIDKNQSSTSIGNAGANNAVGVQNNLISGTNSNASSTVVSISSNNNANNNAQINSEIKPRPGGIRQKPGNLDFKRNGSQRNSPSTNSAESNNNSPNSIASNHNNNHHHHSNTNPHTGGGIPTTPVIFSAVTATTVPAEHHQTHSQTHQHQSQQQHQQTMYMTRGAHIPSMHPSNAAAIAAATAAAVNDAAAAAAATHQPLIGAYNHHQVAPGGVYFKYGQTYFAHPSVATLPNNRRSPPNEIRPLTQIYPTMNMMLPAPRQMQPRHPNPNYKGNKPSR